MKREILFRGKRFDNGEWITGLMLKCTLYAGTAYLIFGDSFATDLLGNVHALAHAMVDPDTVGQYTGLKDALGRKIFEGDIFAFTDCMMFATFKGGAFVLEGTVNGKTKRYPMTACYDDKEIIEIDFIVIGNIYDNPELI